MRLPGFTAEASSYVSTRTYRFGGTRPSIGTQVSPAMARGGGGGGGGGTVSYDYCHGHIGMCCDAFDDDGHCVCWECQSC
jgi:hypothetical protein